jgi:hypothetical protein
VPISGVFEWIRTIKSLKGRVANCHPMAVLLSPFQARRLTDRPAKYEPKTELWMSGVNELALAPPVDDSNAGKVRTGASQHKKAKIHRHPFRDSHK